MASREVSIELKGAYTSPAWGVSDQSISRQAH